MKLRDFGGIVLAVALALAVAGCGHKLVATGNSKSVPLYPDENTYLKISKLKQQGGVEGMVGNLGASFSAKQIDDQTPVKVLSSDNNGAMVQITSGPMQGQSGFVAKENLD
jgi:transcription antitermination factor NusG